MRLVVVVVPVTFKLPVITKFANVAEVFSVIADSVTHESPFPVLVKYCPALPALPPGPVVIKLKGVIPFGKATGFTPVKLLILLVSVVDEETLVFTRSDAKRLCCVSYSIG